MKIRAGYDIAFTVSQATPIILMPHGAQLLTIESKAERGGACNCDQASCEEEGCAFGAPPQLPLSIKSFSSARAASFSCASPPDRSAVPHASVPLRLDPAAGPSNSAAHGASGGSWSNVHIRRLQPHRHRQAAILGSDQQPLRRVLEFQGLDLMAEWAGEDVQFWQSAKPCDRTDKLHRMPTCAADNLGILRVLRHSLSTIIESVRARNSTAAFAE